MNAANFYLIKTDPLFTTINMHLTEIQSLAITARMAAVVGAETFDRLFAGVEFRETDGDILFAYAQDEERAAEMEDEYGLHISIIATDILKREIGIVMVLPKLPTGYSGLH